MLCVCRAGWLRAIATAAPRHGLNAMARCMSSDICSARRRFLVCLDGSDGSFKALESAKNLMHADRGDHLILMTVPPALEINPQLSSEFAENLENERNNAVAELLGKAELACADIPGSFSTHVGRPAHGPRDEILDMAESENVDFIVIGSRGMSIVKRMLMGSVSTYVVNHSKTNVVVVH